MNNIGTDVGECKNKVTKWRRVAGVNLKGLNLDCESVTREYSNSDSSV